MTAHTDIALRSVSPAPISGDRDQAFLQALARMDGDRPVSDLVIQDALNCPASALPALIAEYSLEEFIDPDLPENEVRAIIGASWRLHEGKGYDEGVQLGLSLLGIDAEVNQWYQQKPLGAPNTHRINLRATRALYPNENTLGPRHLKAAVRMIESTKRLSQGTTVVRRRDFTNDLVVAQAMHLKRTLILRHDPVPELPAAGIGLAAAMNYRRTLTIMRGNPVPQIKDSSLFGAAIVHRSRAKTLIPAPFANPAAEDPDQVFDGDSAVVDGPIYVRNSQ